MLLNDTTNLTLRQMEAFTLVCSLGSINKAASLLFISQPSLSRMLRELEEMLGCDLLKRSATGVEMTPYGEYVRKEFDLLLKQTDNIKNRVRQMKATQKKHLFFGISEGGITAFPFDFLSRFTKQHPNIDLNYNENTDKIVEEKVMEGKYALAILAGPTTRSELELQPLKSEKYFLCIPQGHPFYTAGSDHISMRLLNDQPFVMFGDDSNVTANFADACKRSGVRPRIMLQSSCFASIKLLSVDSSSLFLAPQHLLAYAGDNCRCVPFPDDSLTESYYIATNRHRPLSDAAMLFYNYMTENYGSITPQKTHLTLQP